MFSFLALFLRCADQLTSMVKNEQKNAVPSVQAHQE
jgi:hypothetical protein